MALPWTLWLAVTLVAMTTVHTRVAVEVDQLGDNWDFVGDIEPKDLRGFIGANLTMNCTVRRKTLDKYRLRAEDLYYKFRLLSAPTAEITVPDRYVTYPRPRKASKTPNRARLAYPAHTLEYDNAGVACWLRVNATHEVEVDSTLIYVGFPPAEGRIEHVMTQDLRTLTIKFSKAHTNPVYVTSFSVWLKVSAPPDYPEAEFRECVPPLGELVGNDSCRYDVSALKQGNGHIEVYIRSTSINGSKRTVGPTQAFYLYEKYRPKQVENLTVTVGYDQTSVDQSGPSAVIAWRYPSVPIPLLFNVRYRSTTDNVTEEVEKNGAVSALYGLWWQVAKNETLYYHNGPITVTVSGLRWGTRYVATVTSQPGADGYLSDGVQTTFWTEDNVPARNPVVHPGNFDRRLREDGNQDLTLYWEPVPQKFSNGNVTEVKVMVIPYSSPAREPWTQKVADPALTQVTIPDLSPTRAYGLVVMAATRAGYNDSLPYHMVRVSRREEVPFGLTPHNLTVLTAGQSGASARHMSVSWATTDTPPAPANQSIVLCLWVGPERECENKRELTTLTLPAGQHDLDLTLSEAVNRYKVGVTVLTPGGWTGIYWSRCVYDRTKVATAPTLVGDPVRDKKSLTLRLSRPPCDMMGYPYGYRVVLNSTDNDHEERVFLNTSAEEYTVDRLIHNTAYSVLVYSLSEAGPSRSPLRLGTVSTQRIKIEICISVTLGLIVIISFLIYLILKFHRNLRKKQDVVLPEVDILPAMLTHRSSPDGGQIEEEFGSDPYTRVLDPVEEDVTKPTAALLGKMKRSPKQDPVSLILLKTTQPGSEGGTMETDLSQIMISELSFTPVLMQKCLSTGLHDSDDAASGTDTEVASVHGTSNDVSSQYLASGQGMEDMEDPEGKLLEPPANHRQVMAALSTNHSLPQRTNQSPPLHPRANQSPPQTQDQAASPTTRPTEDQAIPEVSIRQPAEACSPDRQSTSRGSAIEDYPRIRYTSDSGQPRRDSAQRLDTQPGGEPGSHPAMRTSMHETPSRDTPSLSVPSDRNDRPADRETSDPIVSFPSRASPTLPATSSATNEPPHQGPRRDPLGDASPQPSSGSNLGLMSPDQSTEQSLSFPVLGSEEPSGLILPRMDSNPGLMLNFENLDDDDSDLEEEEDPEETQLVKTVPEYDPYRPAQHMGPRPLARSQERPPDHRSPLLQRPESGIYSPEPSPAIISHDLSPRLMAEDDNLPDEGILSLTESDQLTPQPQDSSRDLQASDPYRPGFVMTGPLFTDPYQPGVCEKSPPTDIDGYSPGLEVDTEAPSPSGGGDNSDPYTRAQVIR